MLKLSTAVVVLVLIICLKENQVTACNFTAGYNCMQTNNGDELFNFNPFINTYSTLQITSYCNSYSAAVSCAFNSQVNCTFDDLLSLPSSPPGSWKGTFDAFSYLCTVGGKQDFAQYLNCRSNNCPKFDFSRNYTCGFYRAQLSCAARASQTCSGTQFVTSFSTRRYQPSLSIILSNCTLTPPGFTTFPSDTTVSVGSNVTFRCQPSNQHSSLSWYKYEHSQRVLLYDEARNYILNATKYNVTISSGVYSLNITSAQLTDGSPYSCQTTPDFGEAFANLLVADVHPASMSPNTLLTNGTVVVSTCIADIGGPTAFDDINPLSPNQKMDLQMLDSGSTNSYFYETSPGSVFNSTTSDQSITRKTLIMTKTVQTSDFGESIVCQLQSVSQTWNSDSRYLPIQGCTWIPFSNATSSRFRYLPEITTLVDCQAECLKSWSSCYNGIDWFPDNDVGKQCAFSQYWVFGQFSPSNDILNNYYSDYSSGYLSDSTGSHYMCFKDIYANGCNEGLFNACHYSTLSFLQLWISQNTSYQYYSTDSNVALTVLTRGCNVLQNIFSCFDVSGCLFSQYPYRRNITFLMNAYKNGCTQMKDFVKLETCLTSYSTFSHVPNCYAANKVNQNSYSPIVLLSYSMNYDTSLPNATFCKDWSSNVQCFLSLPERCGSTEFILNFSKILYGESFVRTKFGCEINSTTVTRQPDFCDGDIAIDFAASILIPNPPEYTATSKILSADQLCSKFYSQCFDISGCLTNNSIPRNRLRSTPFQNMFNVMLFSCNHKTEMDRIVPCFFFGDWRYTAIENFMQSCTYSSSRDQDVCRSIRRSFICQLQALKLFNCGSVDFNLEISSIMFDLYVRDYNCTLDLPDTCTLFKDVDNSSCSASVIVKFRMADKQFISDYADLKSSASIELSTAICNSFKSVLTNKTSAYFTGCKIQHFTNGSVYADTQLDFVNSTGSTDALANQVQDSLSADFNSTSGVFQRNLNSSVDGLSASAVDDLTTRAVPTFPTNGITIQQPDTTVSIGVTNKFSYQQSSVPITSSTGILTQQTAVPIISTNGITTQQPDTTTVPIGVTSTNGFSSQQSSIPVTSSIGISTQQTVVPIISSSSITTRQSDTTVSAGVVSTNGIATQQSSEPITLTNGIATEPSVVSIISTNGIITTSRQPDIVEPTGVTSTNGSSTQQSSAPITSSIGISTQQTGTHTSSIGISTQQTAVTTVQTAADVKLNAQFKMKDTNFTSELEDLKSNASKTLTVAICKSFDEVLKNKTSVPMKNCNVSKYSQGSVNADADLFFPSSNTKSDALQKQVVDAVNADFANPAGTFKTNLKSNVTSLQVSSTPDQPATSPPASGSQTGAIVGGVVGGLVGIGLVVVVLIFVTRSSGSMSGTSSESVSRSRSSSLRSSPPESMRSEKDSISGCREVTSQGFITRLNVSNWPFRYNYDGGNAARFVYTKQQF